MSPSTTQPTTSQTPTSLAPTRRTLLALGLGGLLLGAVPSTVIADDEKETSTEKVKAKIDIEALRSLSKANQEFAYDFYRQGIHPGENLVLSPYGISECFALLYAGSSADTAHLLEDLFHYPVPPEKIAASFGNLRRLIDQQGADETCRIDIASSCWAGKESPVLPGYARDLESNLDGEIFSVDFSDADAVEKRMNAWVDENTNGLIKEAGGPVSPATLLILMNTVYLDATWQVEFKKRSTRNRAFTLADGRSVNVPTMSQEQTHRYLENEDAQIIELPYVGNQVSMTLVLPKEGRSLADLEKTLSAGTVAGWDRAMKKRSIALELPKFELSSELDLKQLLGAMTSTGLFASPNLSRMLEGASLQVTDASQDAVIKVDESGTEAAALTKITVGRSAKPRPEPTQMSLDRPFMYLVRDRVAGTIYFMGRVMDPRG